MNVEYLTSCKPAVTGKTRQNSYALVCYRTLGQLFGSPGQQRRCGLSSAFSSFKHLSRATRTPLSKRTTRNALEPRIHCAAKTTQKKGEMPRVARIRVPIYQETGKHTLYRIEVTTDDGRTRKVERRYRDVLRFHGTLCRAAPHPKLEQFDFPHKSILNTNAEFTKERRRSGFEAYFALLLSLGPNYAPFVETFLKADERSLDDSGHSRPPTPTPVAQPALVFDDD